MRKRCSFKRKKKKTLKKVQVSKRSFSVDVMLDGKIICRLENAC